MQHYSQLREDLEGALLAELRADVRGHYEWLVRAQRKNEFVAIDLAQILCERLELLLDTAPSLSPAARSSIVGAARYFVSVADAVPDKKACTGLDDDVEVFNQAAREVGRADLVIVA